MNLGQLKAFLDYITARLKHAKRVKDQYGINYWSNEFELCKQIIKEKEEVCQYQSQVN